MPPKGEPIKKFHPLQHSAPLILSVGEDSEGEYLDVVEDDETLMEVSKLFEQRLSDQFEIE